MKDNKKDGYRKTQDAQAQKILDELYLKKGGNEKGVNRPVLLYGRDSSPERPKIDSSPLPARPFRMDSKKDFKGNPNKGRD